MAHNEQTLESRLLLWTADWLTVLLLSAGMVFPCLSAYGVSGQYGFDTGAVLAFCIFGSAAVSVMFTWRHGYWAALAVLGAGGLVFWRLWVLLAEDWNRGRNPGLSDLIDSSPEALFLIYALVVLTLGWVVVRVRTWWLAAALVVLPLLPAIQAGILPSWWAMLAGFAGWGSMLLTELFSRKDTESLARAKLLSLGGMAALLLALVMCLPRENYVRPQWATDARASLIRTVNRQLLRFFDPEDLESSLLAQLGLDLSVPAEGTSLRPGEGSGAMEITGGSAGQREDLLDVGPQKHSGKQILILHTDQPNPAGRIYLRGMSFDDYTGTSWESSFQSGAQPGRYPALAAPDAPEYTMTVRDSAFRGVWFYPYRFTGGGLMNESGRITGLSGGQAEEETAGQSLENYQITYRPGGPENGAEPLEGRWAEEESRYRYGSPGFQEAYLAVPRELETVLTPLLEELRREAVTVDTQLPGQFQEPVAAAARTAGYLASVASYDPNTPAMEPDEDFVAHFLEEGRGYCVHFATAGAMLLRMQGVPARYVSGYVAELNAQGQGRALDSDAHAWVEIYIDGYGWHPVEMTPGYSGGESGVELEGGVETPAPEEPAEEEPEEESLEEELQPDRETPEDAAPDGDAPDGVTPEEEAPEKKGLSPFWKWLFGAAVLWAALCAAYLTAQLVRRRARADGNANRSVLNAYGRYKRLRRWGCGEDEELERLAKKAKFSQHTLTAEERESAWKCLDEDVRQSRIGQPVRRKWLLALLCPLF